MNDIVPEGLPSLYLEIPAIVAGALSGGLHAVERRMDAVGIAWLAIATGLGGGLLRDALLGSGPALVLLRSEYLLAVSIAAALVFFFAPFLARMRLAIELVDALALGFFGIVGAERALALGLPIPSAILLGTISGIGGSILRDVLANEVPRVMLPGRLHALPSVLGVGLFASLSTSGFAASTSALAGIAATLAIWALGRFLGWRGPSPLDVVGQLRDRLARRTRRDGPSE
ncbi:trimeric intracellular cation channel family protein [Sandaracinus amylolyticus]|uniref:trimeric intracellular cation channel family protein n=1 Tax=Sandaracinus amylolyticus TaxID=927083 RepID=UPI001F15C9CF|nr:TRIC cation channel family protein [Sandaracinus amylolyticus]UJR82476.1 Hypothetical protein I5071_45410 [Sandaracinus amylolyticus]